MCKVRAMLGARSATTKAAHIVKRVVPVKGMSILTRSFHGQSNAKQVLRTTAAIYRGLNK